MTKIVALQKTETKPETASVSIRMPEAKDGKDIYALVKESGTLDANSEYAYLLLGEHFKETCVIAEEGGKLAGFVSAYIPPNQPDVLFVWQIAVSESFRRRGLGRAMIYDIMKRKSCENIKYIHVTISPSNSASRSLFTSLARDLDTSIREQSMFQSDYFSDQHEDEPLFVIGPFVHLSKGKTL